MSTHALAEAGQATPDAQVIAELAAGALESIARIHAAGLAEVVDIAENPPVVRYEPPVETPAAEAEAEAPAVAPAETPVAAEAQTEVEIEAVTEAEAVEEEPATAEFATPAQPDVVQPVEALRAVPKPTRGRHFSEAETTEFTAQRAA